MSQILNYNIPAGSIGFSNNKSKGLGSVVPSLIRFFTSSKNLPLTHSFVINFDLGSIKTVIEASAKEVSVSDFESNYLENLGQSFYIYKLNPDKVSINLQEKALEQIISKYLNQPYGYLQLFYFPIKSLLSLFGYKKPFNNPFTHGLICSELCFDYLTFLGLGDLLRPWNANNIDPTMLYNIINKNPDLFIKVLERGEDGVLKWQE
jgi:hypothetical protein